MNTPKLKTVYRLDSVPLSATYWTREGYLKDEPIVTSVGIFEYLNDDGSKRRELRLPENVFDPASLASYEGKPVIITHDAGEVDKNNVQREIIGTILSPGIRDGDDVRAKIVIHNTDAMKRSGLKELSLGYSLDLDETPGVWNGQPYDAIQKNIRINHLALVQSARAGEQARLNIDSRDAKKGVKVMKNPQTTPKKNRQDGGPLTPEEMEKAIAEFQARKAARSAAAPAAPAAPNGDEGPTDPPAPPAPAAPAAPAGEKKDEGTDPMERVQMVKDRRDRRDADGDPADQQGAMATIAQMDEDIDTLLEVIDAIQAKSDFAGDNCGTPANADGEGEEPKADGDDGDKGSAVNADSVDAIVRERVRLIRMGEKLHLDGIDSMSATEAKKAIIKAVRPTMRLDGKSDAYLKAAFDMAADEVENMRKSANYQRQQMLSGGTHTRTDGKQTGGAAAHRQQMIENQNGGKK